MTQVEGGQVDGEVEGGLGEPTELEPEQGSLDLADPADRWTRSDWEKQAAGVLRKARRLSDDDPDDLVWDRLTRTTLDGVAVSPLGTPELLDDLATAGRPTRQGDWDVRSLVTVDGPDGVARAHEEALVDLDGGVTSLWMRGGRDWTRLLDGVLLDLAAVVLDGTDTDGFLAYAEGRDLHPATNLGVPAAAATPELARRALERGVLGFVVDATTVHDRGASDAQELAWSLATGATYLRTLTAAGLSVDEAAGLVEFRHAATDEQFPTIAKLRAARRLWARVLELSGVAAAGAPQVRLHAVTSRPMTTRYDAYVNLLRATVAAFAAGLGGADSVTVLPFDSPLGRPDAFGRRIARNISHLLIDEAHVAHVADPAGGAYAVERLTDDLAVAAWDLFGRLEEGASLDDAIAATVAERDRQVATRRRPITGLSEFPALGESLPERDGAADAGDDVRRWGAAFEGLRDDPPVAHVLLATLGPVAAHTARAGFATNLLAAGGVAVDVAGATTGPEDLVAAHDGHRVVCLAGTDAAYDDWGAAAAEALRAAGAAHVVVAGRPREWADDACAIGVDAIAFLTRTRQALEAQA